MIEFREKSNNDSSDFENLIAYDRDRFAADRTILAWIRTSLALIGFGFSIFEFFQYLKTIEDFSGRLSAKSPHHLGIILVALGVVFLILATMEYLSFIRKLDYKAHKKFRVSTSLAASLLLSIIGLTLLIHMLVTLQMY